MDREKALRILGLPDGATPDDITKRVDVLYRKFRQMEKDENGSTFADVEAAFRLLMGITYRDEEEEKKKKHRQEHPNPILKLLKIDEEKARNAVYYYKWPVLITLLVAALLVSIVLTAVNKREPDLKVIIAGNISAADTVPLENRIKKEIPRVKEILVQNIILADDLNPQMQVAMQQKLMVELAEGKNDIYIMDEATYRDLAKSGAFIPLEDTYISLNIPKGNPEDLMLPLQLDDGKTYEPRLYGLDVTRSSMLKDAGIVTNGRIIVSIGHDSIWPENAIEFIRKLLETIP
ncbi:MAG: hypothetical protein N2376_10455 [Clostridia bacterium]|nr:hypothetical protein [Clostridia bacterium]